MRALVVREGQLALADEPTPQESGFGSDVVIRPRLTGVCNTDLELVAGYYGYQGILGHEFVGAVVAGGAPELLGQRVVGEINIACGNCDFCRAGIPSQCRQRGALGIQGRPGVFAELTSLPVENVHAVPAGISDRQAVFTEPLAAALQTLEMAHIRPSDRVIILGAGKLGMLIAQVIRLTGADLAVVVRHDKQAALLARWGIPAVRFETLPAAQADVVVDCTGRSEGFRDALTLLRARGTLVLKSTYHGLPQADLTRVAVEEVHVVGSRCGDFPAALRLLAAGVIDTESLIDHAFTLAAGVQAFKAAAQPGTLKVLIEPDS